RYGLFEAAGSWMAAGSRGRPVSLLAVVFAAASVVTAVLSLDATVVLLTPVVFATVARLGLVAAPGLEPHQPAGLRRERALLRALRGDHGTPLARGDRCRMAGTPSFL